MWLFKRLLIAHVTVFLYLLMELRVQRTESSLQHALPLYSLDYHRNDLAGEGSVVPVLYLQVVVLFSHSVMSDALQPHVAGSSVLHYLLEFAPVPVL